MKILVFADSSQQKITKSSLEAISYAGKIASEKAGQVIVATWGNVEPSILSSLGSYGAHEVVNFKNLSYPDNQLLSKFIVSVVKEKNAELVVFSQDYTGKSVAPRVSAKLQAGLISGVISYPDFSNGFVVKKSVFSGKAFAKCKILSPVKVVSITPNSIGVNNGFNHSISVSEFTQDLGSSKVSFVELKKKGGDGISLTEADIVVSAGRGLKGPENWGMIETLANELGAATACSRPVADIGWRPHHEHVGQTGVTVRPNLYFAIGISGAIQHLAGVNGSKVIVVINNDKEAPFFKAANYGIIGDAFEVVPKLIDSLKKFKESNN